MAILYNFITKEDNQYLTVLQDTNYTLHYTSYGNVKKDQAELLEDSEYLIPISEDGNYTIVLTKEGETTVNISFSVIKFLQKSIIKDVYELLHNGGICNCGCKKENIKCISKEALRCLNDKGLFNKLLSFQILYANKYSLAFKTALIQYIQDTILSYPCNLQGKINKIVQEACITGSVGDSSCLFKIYAGVYWSAMYFTEYRLYGITEEEKEFINKKFMYSLIQDSFCSLGIGSLLELSDDFNDLIDGGNTPPTVSNSSISSNDGVVVDDILTYTFDTNEFINNYLDAEGDSPNKVTLITIPIRGTLVFEDSSPVMSGVEYDLQDFLNAVYTVEITDTVEIFDVINFRINDDNSNPLYSNMATITINTAAYQNQPVSQIGDATLNFANRQDHVFTVANFTTDLTPPYLDPEGDPLHSVRINSLPASGTLLFQGNPVVVGQIITAAQIANGDLVNDAPESDSAASVSFDFSVRDTGSMIWVG